MKKGVFALLFFAVLIVPFISAIDINMPSNISSGQTVIASVQGNFLDAISKTNIKFYRDYVETAFDYDVAKIGDTYYIYFQTLNKAQNNYSINISGVRYYVGAQVSTEVISKQFTLSSEQADFYVNKGFVITSGSFFLTVQNLNPSSITITVQTEINSGSTYGLFDFLFKTSHISSGETLTLLSGEMEDININLNDLNETTIRTITLSTANTEYKIPAYVILQNSPTNTSSGTTTNTTDNSTVIVNETKNESTGGSFWDLFKKENKTSETPVNTSSNTTGTINDTSNSASLKTCSELKGSVCKAGSEICDGTTITAKDDLCCIGTCTEKPKSNTGKIVGWTIIGLIVILLIFFKMKLNNTKRKKINLLKVPPKKF